MAYVVEAAGDAPGWDAIEVASLERAREVRQQLGLDAETHTPSASGDFPCGQ